MRSCATTWESELRDEELLLLLETIRHCKYEGPHLEVGTAAGGTLWQMMSCFSPEERPPFVVVDPMRYFPDQLGCVKRNLHEHGVDPAGVQFWEMTSAEAVSKARGANSIFDFIFIDGSHKIRGVMQDLRWAECLNQGGIIAFHDYCKSFPGVRIAVDRFLARHPMFRRVGHVDSLLLVRKEGPMRGAAIGWMDRIAAWLWSPLLKIQRALKRRWAKMKKAT